MSLHSKFKKRTFSDAGAAEGGATRGIAAGGAAGGAAAGALRVRVRVRVVRVRCTFEDIFSGSEQVQYTYCTTYVYRLYTYTYSFFCSMYVYSVHVYTYT